MRHEFLVLGHYLYSMSYAADTFLCEMLEGNLAVVAIEVHATIGGGISMGGQGMVCTAGIVASTLTSIQSEEYATCIHHFLSQLLIVGSGNNQVFGSISVTQIHGFLTVVYQYEGRILQGLGSQFFSG